MDDLKDFDMAYANFRPNDGRLEDLEEIKKYLAACGQYFRNEGFTIDLLEKVLQDIRVDRWERREILKNAAQIMSSWMHEDDVAPHAALYILDFLVKIKREEAAIIVECMDQCYCPNGGTGAGKLAFLALGFYQGLFAIQETIFEGVDLYPVAGSSAGGLAWGKDGKIRHRNAFSRSLHALPSLEVFGNFANATEAFEAQVCTKDCFLSMLYTLATCGTAEQLLSDINEQSLDSPAFEALVNGTVAYVRNAGFKHVRYSEIRQIADTAMQLGVKGEQYSTLVYEYIKKEDGSNLQPLDASEF